jgi:hypothetical protein
MTDEQKPVIELAETSDEPRRPLTPAEVFISLRCLGVPATNDIQQAIYLICHRVETLDPVKLVRQLTRNTEDLIKGVRVVEP